jgi:hypothetical protein
MKMTVVAGRVQVLHPPTTKLSTSQMLLTSSLIHLSAFQHFKPRNTTIDDDGAEKLFMFVGHRKLHSQAVVRGQVNLFVLPFPFLLNFSV